MIQRRYNITAITLLIVMVVTALHLTMWVCWQNGWSLFGYCLGLFAISYGIITLHEHERRYGR
jgi:hypothetical protein